MTRGSSALNWLARGGGGNGSGGLSVNYFHAMPISAMLKFEMVEGHVPLAAEPMHMKSRDMSGRSRDFPP